MRAPATAPAPGSPCCVRTFSGSTPRDRTAPTRRRTGVPPPGLGAVRGRDAPAEKQGGEHQERDAADVRHDSRKCIPRTRGRAPEIPSCRGVAGWGGRSASWRARHTVASHSRREAPPGASRRGAGGRGAPRWPLAGGSPPGGLVRCSTQFEGDVGDPPRRHRSRGPRVRVCGPRPHRRACPGAGAPGAPHHLLQHREPAVARAAPDHLGAPGARPRRVGGARIGRPRRHLPRGRPRDGPPARPRDEARPRRLHGVEGLPVCPRAVARFIAARDGIASDPEAIFLTDGASKGVQAVLG